MPRTFWYHVAITCILSLGTAVLVAGRGSYEENALYRVFCVPGSALEPMAFPCLFALLGVAGLLAVRINGSTRPLSFIALYVTVLFVPFLYLATHFWIDLLAVLLLTLSMRLLIEPGSGVKPLATALLPLLAAVVLRGQLAPAALAAPLYLLAAHRGKAALVWTILFASLYAALFSLDLGATGRVWAVIPAATAGGPYATENLLALFRNSLEFQLIFGFTPFVLAAAVGLSLRGLSGDRPALFLVLSLFLLSLLLFPAAVLDPGTARLYFMMMSLYAILGANGGIRFLQDAARGPRALRWSCILAGLFLLPALISFI